MTRRICVIGAGSSGIAAVRALSQTDLDFDCFEMGSNVGGNWRYNNDNGRSSAYNSLHIDTSKPRMQYSDLPMSDEYPAFPHHSQVLEYFERYVDQFDLRRHMTFRSKVVSVNPLNDGSFEVLIENVDSGEPERRIYTDVMVCNGHHWNPKLPEFPGTFDGMCTHSHHYRTSDRYKDKRVLVLGVGNSGADISSEVSRVAQKTFLAMRRNPRIIPRFILGYPLDLWNTERSASLPLWLQQLAYKGLLAVTVGDQSRYGFPRPDHTVLTEHPTVSAELLNIVAHGGIHPKPNIKTLKGNSVEFTDGSIEEIDAIIYATGYRITFPFLDPDYFSVEQNDIRLFRHVVSPSHPGLYFIGLVQPLGAIMPLAEQQSQWVVELLTGQGKLPTPAEMERAIQREKANVSKRYVASTRHTIQVDYFPYLKLIEKERRASRARA